jgi:hypothetical protein
MSEAAKTTVEMGTNSLLGAKTLGTLPCLALQVNLHGADPHTASPDSFLSLEAGRPPGSLTSILIPSGDLFFPSCPALPPAGFREIIFSVGNSS